MHGGTQGGGLCLIVNDGKAEVDTKRVSDMKGWERNADLDDATLVEADAAGWHAGGVGEGESAGEGAQKSGNC